MNLEDDGESLCWGKQVFQDDDILCSEHLCPAVARAARLVYLYGRSLESPSSQGFEVCVAAPDCWGLADGPLEYNFGVPLWSRVSNY